MLHSIWTSGSFRVEQHDLNLDWKLINQRSKEPMIYDVDMPKRIIEEFIAHDRTTEIEVESDGEIQGIRKGGILFEDSKLMVAKLVDGYLVEIAKDPNLPLSLFFGIAEMVSRGSSPAHGVLFSSHSYVSQANQIHVFRIYSRL